MGYDIFKYSKTILMTEDLLIYIQRLTHGCIENTMGLY